MLYVYWFCFVFINLVFVVIALLIVFGPKHKDLENVLNAVEKTFPDSSTYNVCVFCEENYKYRFSQTYFILMALEEQEVVCSFTRDGVFHNSDYVLKLFERKKQLFIKNLDSVDEKHILDENEERIPVLFWQIIGRLNKDKQSKIKKDSPFGNKTATQS